MTHNIPTNVTQEKQESLYHIVDDGEVVVQLLSVFENGSLHISKVDDTDSTGQYQCTAVNRLGVAKGDVQLTVVGGMAVFYFAFYCFKINPCIRSELCSRFTKLLQYHNVKFIQSIKSLRIDINLVFMFSITVLHYTQISYR